MRPAGLIQGTKQFKVYTPHSQFQHAIFKEQNVHDYRRPSLPVPTRGIQRRR